MGGGGGVGAAAAARALDALGYVPALPQVEEEEARTKAWRQRVRPAKKAAADHGGDVKIVPPPRERVDPVLAVLCGEDPGPRVQAAEWGLS